MYYLLSIMLVCTGDAAPIVIWKGNVGTMEDMWVPWVMGGMGDMWRELSALEL